MVDPSLYLLIVLSVSFGVGLGVRRESALNGEQLLSCIHHQETPGSNHVQEGIPDGYLQARRERGWQTLA